MADPPPIQPVKIQLAEVAAKAKAQARIGTVVSGRYRLIEVLAMGGVGVVYKGEHVHMRKWVAVKLLHPDSQNAPDLVARFHREAVAGAHIQHPNVTAATDFGELEDGSFFLVLEFVRGATLREIIQRGPMPARRAVHLGKQLALALAATHAIGIVHRDVTPRNVMVVEGEREQVKLIDFGLAKLDSATLTTVGVTRGSASDFTITATGAVFGTIAYLAPEVALGMDLVDARADLYAFGIVLYEMLSGKHPFATTDAVELFKHHAAIKPPPIAQRAPGVVVPAALEAVAMRLLEKAPAARYPNAEAVIAALDAALDGSWDAPSPISIAAPASVPASIAPPAAPAPAAGRSGALPWYAAGGLAAIAVAACVVWWSRSSPADAPAPGASAAPQASAAAASAESRVAARTSPSAEPKSALPAATASAKAAAPAPSQEPRAQVAPAGSPDAVTRALFRNAVGARDFRHAVEHFLALVERDAAAFRDPVIATAARDLVVALASGAAAETDQLFEALATKLGSDGVDILYEIVRTRGGSKAAARAQALLHRGDVMAQATPALRITHELSDAPCMGKLALLDRATREGDLRTLMTLEAASRACFRRNQAVDDALKSLRQRLNARAP